MSAGCADSKKDSPVSAGMGIGEGSEVISLYEKVGEFGRYVANGVRARRRHRLLRLQDEGKSGFFLRTYMERFFEMMPNGVANG
jgi:hypothetical protein